jgi:SAM-dependent methyltransferase
MPEIPPSSSPSPDAAQPNAAQWKNWNRISGPKWVRAAAVMERRLAPVNDLLLARGTPRLGEAVLEIGCGTGATTLGLAEAVGATGRVLAVDISQPMLALAKTRLAEARATHAELLEADAEIHPFPAATFDLATSRFGVMFFANPIDAFRNIGQALAREGRLCFAAWAGIEANPHWQIPFEIVRRHLGPPKPRPARLPGPLAFSDGDYVREILIEAGFGDVTIALEPVTLAGLAAAEEAELALLFGPSGALVEEKQPDEATRAAMRDELAAAFAGFAQRPGGAGLALAATVLLARAKAPGPRS